MIILYHVENYTDSKQKSYEISKMQIARKVARSGTQHSHVKLLSLIMQKNGFMQRTNYNIKNNAATLTTVHTTVLAEHYRLVWSSAFVYRASVDRRRTCGRVCVFNAANTTRNNTMYIPKLQNIVVNMYKNIWHRTRGRRPVSPT
jgi:aminopeptidase C